MLTLETVDFYAERMVPQCYLLRDGAKYSHTEYDVSIDALFASFFSLPNYFSMFYCLVIFKLSGKVIKDWRRH